MATGGGLFAIGLLVGGGATLLMTDCGDTGNFRGVHENGLMHPCASALPDWHSWTRYKTVPADVDWVDPALAHSVYDRMLHQGEAAVGLIVVASGFVLSGAITFIVGAVRSAAWGRWRSQHPTVGMERVLEHFAVLPVIAPGREGLAVFVRF